MTQTVLLDGELVPAASARVPALSRAVLYGEGLFETLRAYGGRAFGWRLHLARLMRSAAELGIPLPPRLAEIPDALPGLLERNGIVDGVVRVSVLAGEAAGGYAAAADSSHLLVTCRPLSPSLAEERARGVGVVTFLAGSLPLAAHKATAYLRSVHAARGRLGPLVREVLLVDDAGKVLEGATSNVLALRRGKLVTPPADGRILPGVTRALVLEIARELGVAAIEGELQATGLCDTEALFLTSSVIELLPVVAVDGRPVGDGRPHALAAALHAAYRERVRRETG